MIETAVQDLRFAFRGWRKSPGFAASAVLTLALGIGENTAIFSVVSGALLRPLPFLHPQSLVQLDEKQPRSKPQGGFEESVVYGDFEEWRARSASFEAMISYMDSSANLQGIGEPEQVSTVLTEPGLFRLLGVAAFAGRTFRDGDPPDFIVASYAFWARHFGRDPSAVGRTLLIDGQPFTLIGVMPEAFHFPYRSPSTDLNRRSETDLWIPWRAPAELRKHPNYRLEAVLARLKPGVSPESARQELNAMQPPGGPHRIVRIRPLKEVVSGSARYSLLVLLGAVAMVLLVACINIANLLLARAAGRAREIAIRSALGASRLRIVRQFLTESVLLALAGGMAGFAIGVWGSRILAKVAAAWIPRAAEINPDWRIFAFLAALCCITGIGVGLAPALLAARGGAIELKRRIVPALFRDALVVSEIALAFILLTAAGLLVRTFLNLERTNPGLNGENVLTLHILVPGARESLAIEERVARIPGVHAAGMISLLPLQNSGWFGFFRTPGNPALLQSELRYVTPGYFRAMGIPLRMGREFSASDGPGAPGVILINEALARRYFPGENPLGRPTDRGVIVGVVGDVRQKNLNVSAVPEIYNSVAQNFAQMRNHGSTLVVRSPVSPAALMGPIRATIREVIPGQALFRAATMQQVVEESLAAPRLYTWLLAAFASMGMLLAAAGTYGVVAYLVSLRTREFGIRIALGAGIGRMLLLVMSRGAILTTLGLAVGLCGAAALTRLLRSALYGVAPTDPVTFAAVAVLLSIIALAACFAPARRAALVDPAVALRNE